VWRQTNEPAPNPTASDIQMNDAENYQVQVRPFPSLPILLFPNTNSLSNFVPLFLRPSLISFPFLLITSRLPLAPASSKQSGTTASSSSSDAPPTPAPCGLLEALTRSYDPDAADELQTSCGEYLELIFIHREAFAARPSAHEGCSAGFSALARALELRAWRADRDADTEAVAAFRHEAWMVAAWMSGGGPWWRGGEKVAD